MAKIRFTDDQLSFSYSLYFIAASYFKKASCKSKIQERKMYVQYQEQKLTKQYHMEEECIHYVEKILVRQLPEEFFHEEVDVYLLPRLLGGTGIKFVGKNRMVCLWGNYGKSKSTINYRLVLKS